MSEPRSITGHPAPAPEALDRTVPDADLPPTLVFLRQETSGASRRMESLVAWVRVTQKRRLRVVDLDAGQHQELVERLGVTELPALVLVKDGEVVGRLQGRARGQQIEDLIRPHLDS